MKSAPALCLIAALTSLAASSLAQEGPIKYRQGVMNAIGGHAGAIAQISYGGVGHSSHLTAHADAMESLTKMVVTAFEQNAKPTADVPSRAKEEIWKDFSDFKSKTDALVKAAADYAATARAGKTDMLAAKLDPLWDACKGCHKKFRAKEK